MASTSASPAPARSGGSCTAKGHGGPLPPGAADGELGLEGVRRGKARRTTTPDAATARPADLVSATSQRRGRTSCGSRISLGGHLVRLCLCGLGHRRLQPLPGRLAGLPLAAHRPGPGRAGEAIWRRQAQLEGLVHHSDRASQYLSIRYTERLAEAGAVTSVGSRGDSYDNALAETIIGLYKTELIRRRGPGRASTRSCTPPWSGLTGPITAGSWSQSATSHRRSSRPPTGQGSPQPASADSSNQASGKPGAVQTFHSGPFARALPESHFPRPTEHPKC
jgi:putative transposase